jgi:hypothetical protein
MAFDQSTRNRLQRLVGDCRKLLVDEFSLQLQQTYGLDPKTGEVTPLDRLAHLSDRDRHTAQLLRETLAHYLAGQADSAEHRQQGIERMIREQAFTVLNRLAALLMMEARGLLLPAVSKGQQSQAFDLYRRVAGTALGEPGDTYRVFLFSLFDEFAQELPALFDRYAPQGRLFPRESALTQVLDFLNHHEVQPLWAEDETLGWIYQYFNSAEERKAMRKASQAPRNSRELAVRNQFFTPRYVVEFLVDNTLGRLWYNWTGGQTSLRERCQYLLVKPDERPEPIARLRDPRTIKLLDPACGSMHFGLYAFDLFTEIYREAWGWEQQHGPGSLDVSTQPQAALKPLSQTYDDEATLLRDAPRLIIKHNIYGVDIDPRAAQIATLALWLRAQRSWHDAGVKAKDRPLIGRGHVIAAVAPPAERELRLQFAANLDKRDAELFEKTLQLLKGLPELGVLLQVERELPSLIRQVYVGKGTGLFAQQEQENWQQAEARLRQALTEFAQAAKSTYQGSLFAQDALQGLRLVDLCHGVFDVVVMNPPFGEFSALGKEYTRKKYTSGGHDFITAFVQSALMRLRENGHIGAITSRTCFFAPTTKKWREDIVLKNQIDAWMDLGAGVLDGAMVETCTFAITKSTATKDSYFCDAAQIGMAAAADFIRNGKTADGKLFQIDQNSLGNIAGSPFSYWNSASAISAEQSLSALSEHGVNVRVGLQTGDDFRFLRCWWESSPRGSEYLLHAKGGQNEPFATDIHLLINWKNQGLELKSQGSVRLNMFSRFDPSRKLSPGLTFAYRTNRFSPGVMPEGVVPGVAGMGVYSEEIPLTSLVALLNSSIVNELINARLANRDTQALYQAGVVSPIPFPHLKNTEISELSRLGQSGWLYSSYQHLFDPSSLLFSSYFFDNEGIFETSRKINDAWRDCHERLSSIFSSIDELALNAYGFSREEYDEIIRRESSAFICSFENKISSPTDEVEKLTCLAIKKALGLDVRIESELNNLPSVALDDYIKSEFLYGRLDVKKGAKDIFNEEDVRISLDEIVGEVFGGSDSVHHEISSAVGFSDITSYLNAPTGFFDAHLKRHSKSRRKAPIYWPLSTTSGSYTLWIYYPSLTSQTLYTAINDFVEPKLTEVGADVMALRNKGSARTRDDEKQFEAMQAFELELIELRHTLLKLAPTYKPNHDDGVQISAAPLWPLFRHKPWQKALKDTWAKLDKGDYDWAHLAMVYWPDRVREKCKTDKSLAIAHMLVELYVEPEPKAKKTRGRGVKGA